MERAGEETLELERNDSLLEAAESGNVTLFRRLVKQQHYFLSTTPLTRDSILHLALQNGHLEFAKEAILRFPQLLGQTNAAGDTALHVASYLGADTAVRFLISNSHNNEDGGEWLFKQNEQGNTPLHVALLRRNATSLSAFFQECTQSQLKRLFLLPNLQAYTALHLLASHFPGNEVFDKWDDIKAMYRAIFICADHLRSTQDELGNTPLHLAISNKRISAAHFLMQRCLESQQRQELSIRNLNRDSVFDLLPSQLHMTDTAPCKQIKELKEMMVQGGRLVQEEGIVERMMDDELYKAALTMDSKVFAGVRRRTHNEDPDFGNFLNPGDNHFMSQTPNGSNIIHIALQQGKEEGAPFIEEALNRFPSLLIQVDCNGDTPLHLAAKRYTPASRAFLLNFGEYYGRVHGQHRRGVLVQPWTTKNYKGNMPIHEALRFNNMFAALSLMKLNPDAASYVNDFGETPLHVYARFGLFPVDRGTHEVFDALITNNKKEAYVRDKDGLTPLLRAAKCGRFRIVLALLEHCPQSSYIRDTNGRTFLHLLRFTGGDVDEHSADHLFEHLGKNLFEVPEADAQRIVLDFQGNTPLHYAIKTENSIAAEVLTRRCLDTEDQLELMLLNNDGDRVLDLLASHDVPTEIVELIRNKHRGFMYTARSSFGVRRADVKSSAGSLSVIAALLATITFGAAFQVPGGFDGESGNPVLLKRVAFQIFLLSDVFAMCSSMVVLFSLLWVMGSCKTFDSFVLLDISFILLQASFYSTLVAFMTGVYVATASKTLWLAIFSCALGAIVILITWRSSILFFSKQLKLRIDMFLTGKSFSSLGGYLKYHKSLVSRD